MRIVVEDMKSEWRIVEGGVPQGSTLAPKLFLVYVSAMPEEASSYMTLFADDAKLLRHTGTGQLTTARSCKMPSTRFGDGLVTKETKFENGKKWAK